MTTTCTRLAVTVVLTAVLVLAASGGHAQDEQWSLVFTPQLWLSNVPFNGFHGPARIAALPVLGATTTTTIIHSDAFATEGPDPTSDFFPQWGGQLAAQYGRWTFAAAGQYVSLETVSSLFTTNQPFPCVLIGVGPTQCRLRPGRKIATEVVQTDRTDVDLTASHFFPDVIPDLMELSLGLGFKWIRASGHRTLTNVEPFPPGNYVTTNGALVNRASFVDSFYGATFPTTVSFVLGPSKKLFLPVTLSPFVGYEERTDKVNGSESSFAKGGTLDVGLRYVFDNGVALYAGYRAQVIDGNNLYVAHGPLFNLSIRFGGR